MNIVAGIENEASTKTQIAADAENGNELEILWTPGDRIGVFGSETANQPFTSQEKEAAASATFTGRIYSNDVIRYAYYPYAEGSARADAVPVTVMGDQEYTSLLSIGRNDIKVGRATNAEGTNLSFTSVLSMLKVRLNVSGVSGIAETEQIQAVKISTSADRALSGNFKLNLETSALTAVEAQKYMRINLSHSVPVSNGFFTSYATIAPNIQAGDVIDIEVITDLHTISCSYTAAKNFQGGKWYELVLDLSSKTGVNVSTSSTLPGITSFSFLPAGNSGKILENEVYYNGSKTTVRASAGHQMTISGSHISGCIPYLYDFNLAPSFTLDSDDSRYVVKVGVDTQVSGSSVQDFSNEVIYSVVDTQTGHRRDYTVEISNTGLPVVVLTQHCSPSASVAFLDMNIPAKDEDFTELDRIAIYEHGVATLPEMACGYRIRGNITQGYPKKPLALKLSSKASVLGMPKHKRWCLLANWKDNTMLRNDLAFELSRRMSAAFSDKSGIVWAPKGKHVELVLNGRYIGNYYLCEQIKIDKNRLSIQSTYESRAEDFAKDPVKNPEPSFANCGYLFEVDSYFDEVYKFRSGTTNLPINMKDDFDATELGQSIFNQVKSDINSIDYDIRYGNWTGLFDRLDLGATVDYFLLQELTMNNEYKHPKSVYMYKDGDIDPTHVAGGRLCFGPGWDYDTWTFSNLMNFRTYNSESYTHNYTSFQYKTESTSTNYVWYKFLVNCPEFKAGVKSRWSTISSDPALSVQSIHQYIDEQAARLAVSAEYNRAIWPHPSAEKFDDYMNGDETTGSRGSGAMNSYSTTVNLLKNYYSNRFAGMSTAAAGL